MSIASRITSIEEHIGDIYDTLELGGFNPYLLPKEYTQLEYIESTGTQYIDTGFKPTQNTTKVVVDGTYLTANTNYFAGMVKSGIYYGVRPASVSGALDWHNATSSIRIYYTYLNVRLNYKYDGYKFYINDDLKADFSTGSDTHFDINLYLFARNNSGTADAKSQFRMYSCKIYDNNTLVRDYIPCKKNSDNEIGLYDLVNNNFVTNSGTGTFTAGAENRQKVVNKNIENIAPSIKQKYLDYMNNGTREIWNNWEKVTGTGENVILNNTVQAPMDLGVGGNTSQVQYSGKNKFTTLLRFDDETKNGVTLKNNGDGSFTITGTATADAIFLKELAMSDILASGTKLSAGSYVQQVATRLQLYRANGEFVQNTWNTFTIDEEVYVKGLILQLTNGNTYNHTFWYQVEEGSTRTAYEPYVGGTASPNPSFPQEITNVTGDVEVLVQNKNLAWNGWAEDCVERANNSNVANIQVYDNRNCLFYKPELGYKDYDNKYIYKMNWKENTQYTFSFYMLNDGANPRYNMDIYYTDGSHLNFAHVSQNKWEKVVFTSEANKTIKYIASAYYGGNRYIDLDTFMVLEGAYTSSNIPTYTPYKEQTFTFPLGSKNLLNLDKINAVGAGRKVTKIDKYNYMYEVTTANEWWNNTNYSIEVEPNTAYTWSLNVNAISIGSGHNVRISYDFYDANNTQIVVSNNYVDISTTGNYTKTFITTSATVKILLRVYVETTSPTVGSYVILNKFMLEKNSTATTYEEYYNERLMVGDYLADNGIHHVRKQIEITAENVNELVGGLNTTTYSKPYITISKSLLGWKSSWTQNISLINNYSVITSTSKIESGTYAVNFIQSYLTIFDDRFTDLATARQLMIGTIIEIQQANEWIEPYTTEQQQAYNEIKQAISYEEQTNISGSSDEDNPIFTVVALKNS